MPSPAEINAMKKFIGAQNLALPNSGTCPIITYRSATSAASLALEENSKIGQHLRALCLGIYYGMPGSAIETNLFNLAFNDDFSRFNEAFPVQSWNGVWIHQGHGEEGNLFVDRSISMKKFYDDWAKRIFDQDGFQYGLMKTCFAARRSNEDSAIEKLANMYRSDTSKSVKLYGANAMTWVPLRGAHLGCPVVSVGDVYYTGSSNFGKYYTNTWQHARDCFSNDLRLNDTVEFLTDAYYELTGFTPEKALPISQNTKGANPDINWYGTGLGPE